jgi:hypothetical protein
VTYSSEGDKRNPSLPRRYQYLIDLTRRLDRISIRLRISGVLTLVLTLSNIGMLIGMVISSSLVQRYNQINSSYISQGGSKEYLSYLWLIGSVVIFVITLAMLGTADTLRRRGDAIFQEISSTFQEIDQEGIDRDQSSSSIGPLAELTAEARISLRTFGSSADQLLIGGRFGPAIYALINFIVVIIATILYSQAS